MTNMGLVVFTTIGAVGVIVLIAWAFYSRRLVTLSLAFAGMYFATYTWLLIITYLPPHFLRLTFLASFIR